MKRISWFKPAEPVLREMLGYRIVVQLQHNIEMSTSILTMYGFMFNWNVTLRKRYGFLKRIPGN